jgi:hypothetical protein
MLAFTVAHKSASNKIRKARGGEEKKAARDEGEGGKAIESETEG